MDQTRNETPVSRVGTADNGPAKPVSPAPFFTSVEPHPAEAANSDVVAARVESSPGPQKARVSPEEPPLLGTSDLLLRMACSQNEMLNLLTSQERQQAWALREAVRRLSRMIASLPARDQTPAAEPIPEPVQEAVAAPLPAILACLDFPDRENVKVYRKYCRIAGWALSKAGVKSVVTLLDGKEYAAVNYGGPRNDVVANNPDFKDMANCGFDGSISTEGLSEGTHVLGVRVTDNAGGQHDITRHFQVRFAKNSFGEVPEINEDYAAWLAKKGTTALALRRAGIELADLTLRPKISLVLPAFSPFPRLARVLRSVRDQVYDGWELCLCVDPCIQEEVEIWLAREGFERAKVRVIPVPAGKFPAAAMKAGCVRADGDYVLLMGEPALLDPLALFHAVSYLQSAPETDVLYADSDKVDENGYRWDPFFKPDWSPELFLSMNYLGPFVLCRRTLLEQVGGPRPEWEAAWDYDLLLRVCEQTARIGHVPRILVSRLVFNLTDNGKDTYPEPVLSASRQALEDALRRREINGTVEEGVFPGYWRVRYALAEKPGVTIIMPSGGKMKFLEPCLESILGESTYPNLDVLVIDNSGGTEVKAYCDKLRANHANVRSVEFQLKPFNFCALNNFALPFVDNPYLILLNDDVTILTPDWVETLLEHAQRPEVGVVGPKLLYPDGTLQHAGVLLGVFNNTGHAFKHFPNDERGYFGLPHVVRNCSAVTFACAMMRRAVYQEVDGMDQVNLPIAFNDVDMCLRIRARGYRVVYTPHAVLTHHESVTKTVIANPGEEGYMRATYESVIDHDPCYNPNLTRRSEDYSLNME